MFCARERDGANKRVAPISPAPRLSRNRNEARILGASPCFKQIHFEPYRVAQN
jgi:hypothetical protein